MCSSENIIVCVHSSVWRYRYLVVWTLISVLIAMFFFFREGMGVFPNIFILIAVSGISFVSLTVRDRRLVNSIRVNGTEISFEDSVFRRSIINVKDISKAYILSEEKTVNKFGVSELLILTNKMQKFNVSCAVSNYSDFVAFLKRHKKYK